MWDRNVLLGLRMYLLSVELVGKLMVRFVSLVGENFLWNLVGLGVCLLVKVSG